MKVALLLTGQLRTYELCKHLVKNILIDNYDTDVFLSIDINNTLRRVPSLNSDKNIDVNTIADVISFFNPKKTYICEDYSNEFNRQVKKLSSDSITFSNGNFHNLIMEQCYIITQGYRILKEYVDSTGIKYDVVMRLRFDQFIYSPSCDVLSNFVTFDSAWARIVKYTSDNIHKVAEITKDLKIDVDIPKSNEIYVFGHTNDWANDQFWIHSHDSIEIMEKFYDEIPIIMNDNVKADKNFLLYGPILEKIFLKFIKKYNLEPKLSVVIGEFCREFYS
jgi:hypothetical protein